MPINLKNLVNAPQTTDVYDAKFFDKRLTGRGGNTKGFLSREHDPFNIKADVTTSYSDKNTVRKNYSTNGVTVNHVPFNPLCNDTEGYIFLKKIDDDAVVIGTKGPAELFLSMKPQAAHIEDKKFYDPVAKKDTTTHEYRMNYELIFWVRANGKDVPFKKIKINDNSLYSSTGINHCGIEYFTNPMEEVKNVINRFKNYSWNINQSTIDDYFANYDIYEGVCKRSEEWQKDIVEILDDAFTQLGNNYKNMSNPHIIEDAAKAEVRYIMNYKVPLKYYKEIFKIIDKNFSKDIAKEICKENLNLLLSDTLDNLEKNKGLITGFNASPNNHVGANYLSKEQKDAVESDEPLILVQAGAGTGKSTTVKYRIKHMVQAGVNPADITALSFTNAAADHLTEINTGIQSITIAHMIDEIYRANFKGQMISTVDTIINTIDIYYPKTPGAPSRGFIDDFQRALRNLAKGNVNCFTDMNNFVEKNYDDVVKTLTEIRQTCLELEIIICYQQIANLKEPTSIASKYLIIDEVQDNSVFEFVYLLKYIEKHRESLFVVGDCSQTLFEFRDANPDALNILENSGTFKCYSLQINYRSNPEILTFANVMLGKIKANQFAQIQLQANNLTPVSEQSFIDKVEFNYHQLYNKRDWNDSVGPIFNTEIRPYIDKCLSRGENVTVLAFTRDEVASVKSTLEQMYPDKSIVSLVPKKESNSTIFTKFIKDYWDSIKVYPYQNIVRVIRQNLLAQLQYLVYNPNKMDAQIRDLLSKWEQSEGATIQSWINQTNNGQMTEDTLRENVKQNMIDYEIKVNGIHQALLAAENQKRKNMEDAANADFIVSTIHSAKGLEFDNVIVLYKNENDLDEEKKRMYYVALTRAKNTEYILAYDTRVSPQIEADYVTILKDLHATAPAKNSPLDRKNHNKHIKI